MTPEAPDPATSHDTTFFYGTPAQVSVWVARFEKAGFVLLHRATDEDGFDTARMERAPVAQPVNDDEQFETLTGYLKSVVFVLLACFGVLLIIALQLSPK